MKKATNNTQTIDVNASYKQVTSFKKKELLDTFWTNGASSMIIVENLNIYTVYMDNNSNCVLGVFNNLNSAKACVIENFYAIRTMLTSK